METAEEAVEPAEPDINELCTDMFEKMAIFLQGELTGLLTYYTLPYSLHAGKIDAVIEGLLYSTLYTCVLVSHAHCPAVLSLSGTCEDYRLLENMNKLTSLKYMEMKDISINISRNLQDLNNKCK